MSDGIDNVLREIDRNLDAATAKLIELISIPSISSDVGSEPDIARAAQWLLRELSSIGFAAEIVQTKGHPVVLARSPPGPGDKQKRLLFYGHYDVQPIGDLDQWTHPPFEPEIIDDNGLKRFYGRGASDSKSQLWTFIEALRAWKSVNDELPAEIIIMLEGEEECGSPSLPAFIEQRRKDLECDVAFICDAEMWSRTRPAITTQLKGLVHERVTVSAPNPDLHSGLYGAVAANPIRILSAILAGIHDDTGRITIDGFCDGVRDIPDALRKQWDALSKYPNLFDSVELAGGVIEGGYAPLEAMWGRPTVDINGITGGNQGPGERSVLPGSATARLSFRLVAGQEPEKIRHCFRRYVEKRIPKGCSVQFVGSGGSSAVVLSQDNPFLAASTRGLEAEWGEPAVLMGTGGAIPLVQQLSEVLGAECVVTGFMLSTDAIHAPDENYDTERLRKGARSWARIFAEVRRMRHARA
jgi:acetylornithine deacetylase/succinyl-diaminopimelate desuccinylase-like protein